MRQHVGSLLLAAIFVSGYVEQVVAFQSVAPSAGLHRTLSRSVQVQNNKNGFRSPISTLFESKDDEAVEPPFKNKGGGGFVGAFQRWIQSTEGQDDIKIYLSSLVIALLLRFTIVEPRYIPSLSMYPTFEVGDQLAVEKVTKRIKPFYRNEVIVFNPPETFRQIISDTYGVSDSRGQEALIKRIVAIQGDEVEVKQGKLYVNGDKQEENFTAEDAAYEFGPVFVPQGCVLVLGDNRNHSLDGHIWGFLPTKNVIGRAVFVYWPPWRLGNEGMY